MGLVIQQAAAAGVTHILAVGTDLATSAECVRLAGRFTGVYAAVGLHPQSASAYDADTLAELRRLALDPKVVAIGEIGLDYFRATESPSVQQRAFAAQLGLAAELSLPVVVHNRQADGDIVSMISDVSRPPALIGRAGVLHCFGGTMDLAEQAQRTGFSISFAGNLTYRRSDDLRHVAAEVPLSWLLIETDSPYLSPEPFRGKTNGPASVAMVAQEIALARMGSLEAIGRETSANAAALFRWA